MDFEILIEPLKYALIAAITTFVYFYINKKSEQNNEPYSIQASFKIIKLYFYLGLIAFLVSVLLLLGSIFGQFSEANSKLIMLVGAGVILLPGFACFLWYFKHSFGYGKYGVESVSIFGNEAKIDWQNVVSIKFNPFNSCVVFKDGSGTKVKAHQHLKGWSHILKAIEENTSFKIDDLKIPVK